jgi:3-dehydro-L-gulonate 2-dehydrogenase
MVAALLSGGLATHQIPTDPVKETGLSQLFLALNLAKLQPVEESARAADAIVQSLLAAGASVRYPGQQVLKTRAENLALGLPIREELWNDVCRL